MRHFRENSDIYIFGFSRGAYTAFYLADMLDYAGLLGPDNEEMVPLIWNAFTQFKMAGKQGDKGRAAFDYMARCRSTLCRPMGQIKFLGLFDAVNSVSGLELLNQGRSTARTIRHAVSIDERRVKFQPVLYRTSDEENQSDVEELWFPGNHADIGGGFQRGPNEGKQLSHTPLVWMIQSAEQAGLQVNHQEMYELGCKDEAGNEQSADSPYQQALLESTTKGQLHSCLDFNRGVPTFTVLGWRFMECIPIRRPKMQPDGSWRMVRWPLHRGEARGIPHDATVHGSVIRRMQADDTYRPGSLIVGGGGRGAKHVPLEYGIGEWELFKHEGDPLKEIYVRKHMRRGLSRADEAGETGEANDSGR